MRSYLEKKKGKKVGVLRVGMPKEVYFEALLKEVTEEVAVFVDDEGVETALSLDKIIYVGKPESEKEPNKKKPGFL